MLEPVLECVEDLDGTSTAVSLLTRHLLAHRTHAPLFNAAIHYVRQLNSDDACLEVFLLKHLQYLSPSDETVPSLALMLLDTPSSLSINTLTVDAKPDEMGIQDDITVTLEELGSDPLSLERQRQLLTEECTNLLKEEEDSKRSAVAKGDTPTHKKSCVLRKEFIMRSTVLAVRILLDYLTFPHRIDELRPWQILQRALTKLHAAWIRCWWCDRCIQSRCEVVSMVTMRWTIWWSKRFSAQNLPRLDEDEDHEQVATVGRTSDMLALLLAQSLAAHILCVRPIADDWESLKSSFGYTKLWSVVNKEFAETVNRSGKCAQLFENFRLKIIARRESKLTVATTIPRSNLPPIIGKVEGEQPNETMLLEDDENRKKRLESRFCEKEQWQSFAATPAKVGGFTSKAGHSKGPETINAAHIMNEEHHISDMSPIALAHISPLNRRKGSLDDTSASPKFDFRFRKPGEQVPQQQKLFPLFKKKPLPKSKLAEDVREDNNKSNEDQQQKAGNGEKNVPQKSAQPKVLKKKVVSKKPLGSKTKKPKKLKMKPYLNDAPKLNLDYVSSDDDSSSVASKENHNSNAASQSNNNGLPGSGDVVVANKEKETASGSTMSETNELQPIENAANEKHLSNSNTNKPSTKKRPSKNAKTSKANPKKKAKITITDENLAKLLEYFANQ